MATRQLYGKQNTIKLRPLQRNAPYIVNGIQDGYTENRPWHTVK